MYDKVVKEAQDNLKPVMDMVAINSQAVEKLVQQQAAYMSEVLNAGLAQARTVSEAKDPASAAEAQKAYVEEMGSKLMAAAKQNLDVMMEAKDALTKVAEGAMKDVQAKVTKAK